MSAPQVPDPDEVTPGRLTVLAGPAAVGKGTLVAEARQRYPELWVSVSATTRPPRSGEVDGVHYRFVDPETFTHLVESGQMLEWAVVHGRHRYGTLRGPVDERLASGQPALLEIDMQGARQVRQVMPEARFVFLAPPSWEELERRLVGRGTESPTERQRRLVTARAELAAAEQFDHVVVNDDVARATQELVSLMGLVPR